ncbi:MAG: hypothetical protein IPM12_03090 [Flavobacteriales bacterium]|nr:hypothetical protein [Flavobacteriales bacterium]
MNAAALWNTVHGDRHVGVPQITPQTRPNDRAFFLSRSSAVNSLSCASGLGLERRLFKNLWLMVGLDYAIRKEVFRFDPDTLAAYPPSLPAPDGLQYSRVVLESHHLELPLLVNLKLNHWMICAGLSVSESFRSRGTALGLDDTTIELYDSGHRNSILKDTIMSRLLVGYEGFGNSNRFRAVLGSEFRRNDGGKRRWVDLRFGLSVRVL